jgi:polysaccharide transporter, PST family
MRSQKKNKLLHNFFSLGAVQAVSSLLQLIVIPHVIKRIGVDGYGVIAVAQVVMFYMAVFIDFGFNQTATKEVTLNKNDHSKISALFYRVLFSKLILCGIAFICLLILLLTVPVIRENSQLYLMAFVFVIGQTFLIPWFFQGLERMSFILVTTLIARGLFTILVFVFISEEGDGFWFLFFLGAGNLLAGLISIGIAMKIYKLSYIRPASTEIARELRGGWRITVSHLSNSTCHYANIFILRLFANDLIVGYYSIAERIYFTIKQVFVVFSQAVYPKVCQLLETGHQELNTFFKKNYLPFFIVTVLGGIAVFVAAPAILYFFMGNENLHSVGFLRMFCVIAVIVCLNIPATLVLLAMNRQKIYFRVYAIATMVNIAANITLANYFQARGTVMAILLTEFLITMGLTAELYRQGIRKQRAGTSNSIDQGYLE